MADQNKGKFESSDELSGAALKAASVQAEDSKDEVATIADEQAPLAATAPKSLFAKTWWAWLLLAIALIGGAVAYSKKRVEDKLNK